MADSEKVTEELQLLRDFLMSEERKAFKGNNNSAVNVLMHYRNIVIDALALLKEQDAKTGTWQWKIHGKAESGGTLGEAICDQCGESTYATAVKGNLNYCPNCGAKMTDRR